jgi:hypothetical protein
MKLPRVKTVKNGVFHSVKNVPYLRVFEIEVSDLN